MNFYKILLMQVPGLFLQHVIEAQSNPAAKSKIRNVCLKIFQNIKIAFADDPEFQ